MRTRAAVLVAVFWGMFSGTACQGRAATRPPGAGENAGGPVQRVPFEREPLVAEQAIAAAEWDGRACSADPRVRACAIGPGAGTPHFIGMAAHGGTIAVVEAFAGNSWLRQADPQASHRLRFGLHDAQQLQRLRENELTFESPVTDVELAAVPGGWVVAAQTEAGIELIWLGEAGEPANRGVRLAKTSYPGLAVGSAGEVLVVHRGSVATTGESVAPPEAMMATMVAPTGEVRWSARLFESSIEPHFGSQVAADDGAFLVARRTDTGVTVTRVERSGAVGPRHLVKASTEYPSLAWCGSEGRLVWSDFSQSPHVRGATIDRAGRLANFKNSEHVLGSTPEHFNASPVLCDGPGSLVLLGGYTGGTGVSQRLDLARIDRTRGTRRGAIAVMAAHGHQAYDPRLVRLDERRVAVGWVALLPGGERSRLALAVVEAPVMNGEIAGPVIAE